MEGIHSLGYGQVRKQRENSLDGMVTIKYWKVLGIADSSALCIVFTSSFDSMTI